MTKKCVAVAALAVAGAVQAQTDVLYVTDGDSARLRAVQGGNLLWNNQTFVRGYPIAVDSTIWIGDYNGAQGNTHEFDLNGVPTGNTGTNTVIQAVDGTTDGRGTTYMLGSAFSTTGMIYRANADLSNPQLMFQAPNLTRAVGITYDPTNNSLWVQGSGQIRNYDLNGNLLSQFNHGSGDGTLAYEPSTDTLWHVRSALNQYAKDGTLLQTIQVNGLAANNWGAEFAIPAPGAAGVLGLGALALGRRRR